MVVRRGVEKSPSTGGTARGRRGGGCLGDAEFEGRTLTAAGCQEGATSVRMFCWCYGGTIDKAETGWMVVACKAEDIEDIYQ